MHWPGVRKLPFGLSLSPGRSLHQGIISLADQAVASATNFATGIIIARACSKEELGLYMLGFSLIFLMTDFQTSLITTPYMVYAPRLKGQAHALYTGSTLIHQLAFCLFTVFGVVCGAFVVSKGIGPKGLGPVLWALSLVIALIMLREHARRVSFARLRLKTAFLFDTSIAVGQISGLLLLAHFGLLSASRAFWVIGSVCGIAVLGWLWTDRECYHPRMSESRADLKKNWVFGKWVFASGLVWALSMNLYPWFLAYFHGTASTGVWAACLGVVSVGNPALLGIQNFVGPKIAHVYAASGTKALRRFVLKITAAHLSPRVSSLSRADRLGRADHRPAVRAPVCRKQLGGRDPGVELTGLCGVLFVFARPHGHRTRRPGFPGQFRGAIHHGHHGILAGASRSARSVRRSGLLAANFVTSAVRAGVFLRLPARNFGSMQG